MNINRICANYNYQNVWVLIGCCSWWWQQSVQFWTRSAIFNFY